MNNTLYQKINKAMNNITTHQQIYAIEKMIQNSKFAWDVKEDLMMWLSYCSIEFYNKR